MIMWSCSYRTTNVLSMRTFPHILLPRCDEDMSIVDIVTVKVNRLT